VSDTALPSIQVGFIGLGRMGGGMARNLRKAGVSLTVFDAHAPAVQALVESGAAAASSAAEVAAGVELLFLCLPYAPQVREALFGDDGVVAGASRGLQVVDTTTLNHADALAIGAEAEQAGLQYSDCPISGMPMRAEDGTLTIMFGGSAAQFRRASPFLNCIGSNIVHCGVLGNGQMMKAVNNVMYNINIAGFCEVLPLAVKAGLDVEQVAEVAMTGSSRSFASEYFVPRILEGQFDSDFALGAAYKDIVNVQQIATRIGAATPVMNAMTAIYQLAMAQGYADLPKSAMIKVYEQVLGQKVRREGFEDT
jgi:3-hydroxyisobutyrate dehydrogenase-like beta-hydroxyacid dehydrogenase